MNAAVITRPHAQLDLIETADYLAKTAGMATAERFLKAVEKTFAKLAASPGLGSPWESPHPRLQGIRTWPVKGFPKMIIFFRPTETGIEVLHVLHGMRDLESRIRKRRE
jgi:toxin ParE1/3/4